MRVPIMTNNCETMREVLGPWYDGELSRHDAEAVRLHVESCARCGQEWRELERLDSALKKHFESQAPQIEFEPFWRAVQQRIAAKRTWHEEVIEWVRSIVSGPGLAWAVPAVILFVLAGLSFNSFWRPGAQRNNFAAVESIDAHGRNVALLREDETKTTVIWLYQEGEDESSGENTDAGPSF
jgi:anti-sigma factor RsiW